MVPFFSGLVFLALGYSLNAWTIFTVKVQNATYNVDDSVSLGLFSVSRILKNPLFSPNCFVEVFRLKTSGGGDFSHTSGGNKGQVM